MTKTAIDLTENWDDVCAPRTGVARLTRAAFEGRDLGALQRNLAEEAADAFAGAGKMMDLSAIAQLLGDKAAGIAIQNDALALRRLYRSPCTSPAPRLRVLALAAIMDIGGNTPLEFLLEGSEIELATFYVAPGKPLPNPMPDHDIAIVVAPDGDEPSACLAAIEAMVTAWPRPVLNLPRNIRQLDRDRLYLRLSGIAGLEIPQTVRVGRAELTMIGAGKSVVSAILKEGGFPLIIRPVGSHAGHGLAKLDDQNTLTAYLLARGEAEFFVSPFVDYASADGMFRKYRIVVIAGKPYACHMAIADDWKVWYLNASMAFAPYRVEEAEFMWHFDEDFGARHAAALREMSDRLCLDYFAIDCAESRDGNLLIFEADNTAIVHDMDPPSIYPYKPGQMRKIFVAFQEMLYRHARHEQASAA